MEKVTARIAVSPPARRVQVEHLGGRRRGDPQRRRRRGVRARPAAARLPAPGHGRLPRPVRRAAQGHAGAAGRRCAALAPTRPDLRLLVVGRGDAGGAAARRRAGWPTGWTCSAPSTTPRRPPRCGRWTCSARPTRAGRASASCSPRRWPPGRPVLASDLDAFRAVLGEDEPPACCSRPGDAAALAERLGGAARRPGAAGGALPPRAARGRPTSTGRWWPRRCCGSTGRPSRPTRGASAGGGGPVTAWIWVLLAVAFLTLVVADDAGRRRGSGAWTGCTSARTPRGRPWSRRWNAGPTAALAAAAVLPDAAVDRPAAGRRCRRRVRRGVERRRPGDRGERARPRARRRAPGPGSRTPCSPSWSTPSSCSSWPGGCTTTPSGTPSSCARGGWCAGCTWPGTAPMPDYFEIAETSSFYSGTGVTTDASARPPVAPPA